MEEDFSNLTPKRRYYLKNKAKVIAAAKAWRLANPGYKPEMTDERKERRRIARNKWKISNPEKLRVAELNRIKRRNRERRLTDPSFKLKELCYGRVNRSLRLFCNGKVTKGKSTAELVGCSFRELVLHLESKWKPGMNWSNHGLRGWHIDHIKAICEFDLTDPLQLSQCFHYTNLQPLWWYENLEKRFQQKERDQ